MKKIIVAVKQSFLYVGFFSLIVNILTITTSIYMLQVYDRVFTSRSQETLILLSVAATVALIVMALLDIIRARLLFNIGTKIDISIGPKVLFSLIKSTTTTHDPSKIDPNILRDVGIVRNYLGGNGIIALFDSPWIPFYLWIIYLFHPVLGIAATISTIILLIVTWANNKATFGLIANTLKSSKTAGNFITNTVKNSEIINSLGMVRNMVDKWEILNNEVIENQLQAGNLGGIYSGLGKFLRSFVQILLMGLGGWLTIHQELSGGGMIATTIILSRALAPVEAIIGTWKSFIEAKSSYLKLNSFLTTQEDGVAMVELPKPDGKIQADKVVMGFGGDKYTLKGINFTILPGEALGIIGPSAAGKSTLARLLANAWKPTAGCIRIDGADIKTWDSTLLGQYLGYLPQDVELFPGTVAENIARMGLVDDNEVINAAKMANIHDLILKLSHGYNTEVGENAIFLSAGQRQRIGLARALYKNPKIIILDEPNASLDSEGEVALAATLRELKGKATTIIISHKPSVLEFVDKILVLQEGNIAAFGPKQEVMTKIAPQRQGT